MISPITDGVYENKGHALVSSLYLERCFNKRHQTIITKAKKIASLDKANHHQFLEFNDRHGHEIAIFNKSGFSLITSGWNSDECIKTKIKILTEIDQLEAEIAVKNKSSNIKKTKKVPKNLCCSPKLYTITEIATDLKIQASYLNLYLEKNNIQYKSGKDWIPYEKYAINGLAVPTKYYSHDKANKSKSHFIKWTEAGRQYIMEHYNNYKIGINADI